MSVTRTLTPATLVGVALLASAASPAVRVIDLAGHSVDALAAPAGTKAIVFLFTSTDCPISNRYAPEVRRVSEAFAPKGVVFRLIYPGRADKPDAIRQHVASFSYAGAAEPFRDPDLALAHFTGATIAPEAAVVVNGTVVYRGRIDDRYVELGVERPAPTKHDLADAIASALAGRPIVQPVTQAFGCYIADLAR